MNFDESVSIIDYLNRRTAGQWWRWALAGEWSWEKVEAMYCRLVGAQP